MIKRYQTYMTDHSSLELYEVIADSSGTVIPVTKILEAKSQEELKEILKNMLTDVEKYPKISFDVDISLDDDDECFVEYSDDVIIDCVDKFNSY